MNLNQVTLPASDLEASVAFYRRMGFRQIVGGTPDYARFECPSGDATFSLHRVEPGRRAAGTVVYFETVELDAEVLRLQDAGFEFRQLPTDQRWLWREAYLDDPAGNTLCLFWAGENRKNPPWRLSRGHSHSGLQGAWMLTSLNFPNAQLLGKLPMFGAPFCLAAHLEAMVLLTTSAGDGSRIPWRGVASP